MMTHHVRVSRNIVNLGILYTPTIARRRSGWAYFEDGSMFVAPFGYIDHDAFEMRMRIAAHLVSSPTPNMHAIRQSNPEEDRFLVINKDHVILPTPNLRLFARNASDGESFFRGDRPFEHIDVAFDRNTFEYLLTSVGGNDSTIDDRGRAIKKAMHYFRGTFVDGILQPNVRLGNGLRIVDDLPIRKSRESDQTKTQETQVKAITKAVCSSVKPPSITPCGEQLNTQSGRSDPNTKLMKPLQKPGDKLPAQKTREGLKLREASLLAKQRELKAKEEALRWIYKMWLLQQKMAKMSVRSIDRHRTPPQRPKTWKVPSTDHDAPRRSPFQRVDSDRPDWTSRKKPQLQYTGDPLPSYSPRTSARKRSPETEFHPGNAGDGLSHISDAASEPTDQDHIFPFNEFSLDDPTPPPALSALRSRLHRSSRRR